MIKRLLEIFKKLWCSLANRPSLNREIFCQRIESARITSSKLQALYKPAARPHVPAKVTRWTHTQLLAQTVPQEPELSVLLNRTEELLKQLKADSDYRAKELQQT